ncbi:MAG TPA: DUF389 domain-containing protein [Gaiellaceae bacterium]|jgi:uncharacterized hydrophobic protein (TIGR00271 family)|nr:DUF389 domain-containing protein [Gaiellaceae bacterium]
MPAIVDSDLARMRADLLFSGAERNRKLSRFWALLILAAVIASAGVIGDSTATVIGAMIVAPLMTPILGTVLSVVSGDGRNLAISATLVVTGSIVVVLVAIAIGELVPFPIDATTSSQVAGRIHPHLIDLVAALATGAVGAFALVRSDVSDTLPGVAIAISLVPPLAVVGLTLESGYPHESTGALLLFVTNVAAILLSGLVVMALYRVRTIAMQGPRRHRLSGRASTIVIVAAVVALAIPLAAASKRINADQQNQSNVNTVAQRWAAVRGWQIVEADPQNGGILVRAIGPLPIPDPQSFRAALDAAGLRSTSVRLELTPIEEANLPAK